MTRVEFARKWDGVRTTHAPSCEHATYELCTCGLRAIERDRAHDLWEIESAETRAADVIRFAREEASARRKRIARRVAFFGLLALGSTVMPLLSAFVFSCWLAGGSLIYLIEAYGPLYSDGSLRGLRGYLRFMFW